jgi:putative CocE/NonD family hydrolase
MDMRRALVLVLALTLAGAAHAYDASLLTQERYDVASEVVTIPVTNLATIRATTNVAGTLYRPVERSGGPAVPERLAVVFVTTPYGRNGGGITGGDPGDLGRFYAERGYLALITDNRGTGDSDGSLEFTKIEVDDAVAAIRWLKARSDVNPDRIGMSGCSYLAGMQVLTAARRPGLRTIVPQAAWYDLARAGLPGGTPKTLVDPLITAIFTERTTQPKNDGTPHTLDPLEALIPLETFLLLDPYVSPSAEAYRARSVYPHVGEIDIPVYLISSWKDDLIEVDHTLDLWRGVSSAEKKMTIGGGGHCAWTDATREAQHAWFDHYLADVDNGIDRDPPVDVVVQGASPTRRLEPAWPLPGLAPTTYYLRAGAAPNQGTLSTEPPTTEERPDAIENVYVAGFNDGVQAFAQDSVLPPAVPRNTAVDTAVYTLPIPPEGLELIGTPRVSLAVRVVGARTQYAAKLYERRADGSLAIAGRGVLTTAPYAAVPERVTFDLFSTSYRFSESSALELHVASSDVLYVLPVAEPSATLIEHSPGAASWIELPVIAP